MSGACDAVSGWSPITSGTRNAPPASRGRSFVLFVVWLASARIGLIGKMRAGALIAPVTFPGSRVVNWVAG
jgi:hypothetical protein